MSNNPFPVDWKLYLLVAVLAAIIDATGPRIAEEILSRLPIQRDTEAKPDTVEKPDDTPSPVPLLASQRAQAEATTEDVQPSSPVPPPTPQRVQTEGEDRRVFGKWESEVSDNKRYSVNTTYQAPSDGFISAFTGGNRPASGAVIRIGEADQTEIKFQVCSRMKKYDGAICPVPKGSYWRVTKSGGGRVTIKWLSVAFSG